MTPQHSIQTQEGGFLFATFKGENSPFTEQVYFALSTDGLHWEALNGEEPVLLSQLGEKGARDPFLLRSHDGKRFYLLATDLSINLNHSWDRAVRHGSQSIIIWESPDLIHWSQPRLAPVAAPDAGCAWAPEAIYDEAGGNYLVFWASTNGRDNFNKHRIWAARTPDFHSFSAPFIYIEGTNRIIDTDIVREGDTYFRFSKDEQLKTIIMERSTVLCGEWDPVENFSLAHLSGYEGPQCFSLSNGRWCLLLDHFARGAGYQAFITDNLSSGNFEPASDCSFPFHFRHGSVLAISDAEHQKLSKAFADAEHNPSDTRILTAV